MTLPRKFAAASAPTASYLLAYLGTTVLAGLYYALAPDGPALMSNISIDAPKSVIAEIGTPLYFVLLLGPLLIVPAFAAIAYKAISAHIPYTPHKLGAPIPSWVILLLLVACLGFCLFQLDKADALNLDVFTCGVAADKLDARMSLLNGLGYPFFFFAYGVNMMLPILAYLAYDKQGHRKRDLALFGASILVMVGMMALTYSKAPLVVFVIMMAATVIVSRSSFRHLIIAGVVCFGAFFMLSASVYSPVGCSVEDVAARETSSEADVVEKTSVSKQRAFALPGNSALAFVQRLLSFGVVQRMASALPFYIHLYQEQETRCGLHGIVRKSIGLGPQKCELSVEVFKVMWPDTRVVGQQPAPSHIAAFGEIGPWWSVTVMALSGLSLGLLGAIASRGSGPLFLALGAAGAGFGYYLTQVPFFASFTYPHGLIAFLTPILAVVLVGSVSKVRLAQIET